MLTCSHVGCNFQVNSEVFRQLHQLLDHSQLKATAALNLVSDITTQLQDESRSQVVVHLSKEGTVVSQTPEEPVSADHVTEILKQEAPDVTTFTVPPTKRMKITTPTLTTSSTRKPRLISNARLRAGNIREVQVY